MKIMWEDTNGITKEDALEVARTSAFRMARHQGRNKSSKGTNVYDVDPKMYILLAMVNFLKPSKKIMSRDDALEFSSEITSSLVVLSYVAKFGEEHVEDHLPPEKEHYIAVGRELMLTLDLILNKDSIEPYKSTDPSERIAANETQVSCDVALRLGEIGILKDDPSYTSQRRKLLGSLMQKSDS